MSSLSCSLLLLFAPRTGCFFWAEPKGCFVGEVTITSYLFPAQGVLFAERTTTFAHSVVRRFQAEVVFLDFFQTTLPVGSKFAAMCGFGLTLLIESSDPGWDLVLDIIFQIFPVEWKTRTHRCRCIVRKHGMGEVRDQHNASVFDEIGHVTRRYAAVPAAVFETAAGRGADVSIEDCCGHFNSRITTTRTEDTCLLFGFFHEGFVHRIF